MGFSQSLIKSLFFFFLTILVISLKSSAQTPKFFTYSNGNFSRADYSSFTGSGDGSIVQGAIQLTPDSVNNWVSLLNRSGRVMLTKPFKIWQELPSSPNNHIVASFNSTFVVNVFPTSRVRGELEIPGEGLAFIIAPDHNTPFNSYGEWLGLTNATLDGAKSNRLVAIELDTVKQDYDPDNNHMGLNFNSVRSNKTVSLSKHGIGIVSNTTNWKLWVEYNGSSKVMDVYMAKEKDPKPNKTILSEVINLKDYVNQYSYIGFSGSTGTMAELNCVLKWDLRVEILPEKKNWTRLKISLGVGVPGLLVLVCCVVVVLVYCLPRKGVDDFKIMDELNNLPGMPREFKFRDLKEATKNFDETMKLGQGGFGVVYKGMLVKEKVEVAVKQFSRESIKGKDDFLSELTIINRLRHKNLVRLIGWCHKGGILLLVYEYMPNGSVDHHLFGGPSKFLSWSQRYSIISGLASALHYLHNEYDQKVVHRDLKSSNILLDSDYNARLGDFGLARAIDNGRTSSAVVEGVAGTLGYIAPETLHTGKATRESDVFGFGAVVLEVVCGRRPLARVSEELVLVDWVWELYGDGHILDAVDNRLGREYLDDEAERLLLLALACSHPIASERPKTETIFQIVSKSVAVPMVPTIKPAFMWPRAGLTGNSNSGTGNTDATATISASYYIGR